jgi:hypothetical protein
VRALFRTHRSRITVTAVMFALVCAASANARVHTPLGVGAWQWSLNGGDFRHLHGAGIHVYRTPIRWELVEQNGHFNFGFYDRMFAAAARHHIRVAPVLFGAHTPADLGGFARYTRRVAKRYGRRGSFWRSHRRLPYLPARSFEVWNEENDPAFWFGSPDPLAYTRLLRVAHRVLRHTVSHASIVFGGTAAGGFDRVQYLTQALRLGAGRYFDTYALHPYGVDAPAVVAAVQAARWTLDAYHAHRKGIAVTEFGWPSAAAGQADASAANRNEAAALTWTVKTLDARRRHFRLRAIDWFAYRDTPGANPESRLGLLSADGAAKPVWWTFRSLARS